MVGITEAGPEIDDIDAQRDGRVKVAQDKNTLKGSGEVIAQLWTLQAT